MPERVEQVKVMLNETRNGSIVQRRKEPQRNKIKRFLALWDSCI